MKKISVLVMPLIVMTTITGCKNNNPKPKVHLVFGALGYKLTNNDQEVVNGTYDLGETVSLKLTINSDYADYIEMPTLISLTTASGDLYPNYTYNVTTGELKVVINEDISVSASTIYKNNLPSFGECSWAEIDKISRLGIADKIFNLGDIKVLKDYNEGNGYKEDINVRIMGFNHDDLANGSGKAGISLEFAVIPTYGPNVWYPYDSDYHGNTNFPESGVNKRFLNSETEPDMFLTSIPNELRYAIKPVIKYASVGETYELTPYITKGFIIAYSECCEDMTHPDARYEGDIYELYKGHPEYLVKLGGQGQGGAYGFGYLTRSPRKYDVSLHGDHTNPYDGVWSSGLTAPVDFVPWDIGDNQDYARYNGAAMGVVCFCI